MPFTELALPKLRSGPEVKAAFIALWATAAKALAAEPEIIRAFVGSIIKENDVAVSEEETKPILIIEWTTETAFNSFLTSEAFAAFVAPIKTLAIAPAELQLFDTDRGPLGVASAPFTEIIRVQLKQDSLSETEFKTSWVKFVQSLKGNVPSASGMSLNLDNKTLVGTIGWESLESRESVLASGAVEEALAHLKETGEFSSIVVEVEPFKSV